MLFIIIQNHDHLLSVTDQSNAFLSPIAQEVQTVYANNTALESLNTEKGEHRKKLCLSTNWILPLHISKVCSRMCVNI